MGKYIINLPDDEHLISWWTYTGTEDGKQHIDFHEVVKTPYKEPDPEAIKQEAYQKGLSDAWDAARKIALSEADGGIQWKLKEQWFGKFTIYDIFKDVPAMEAIGKIRQYEQEQEEIKVGDEVICRNKTAVVTEKSDKFTRIMYSNGSSYALFTEEFVKTGRNFPEIAEVLRKMKGEKE